MARTNGWLICILAILGLSWSGAAAAETANGTAEIELFAGQYYATHGSHWDGPLFGVRGGWNFTDHFGFQTSLEHYEKRWSGVKQEAWWIDFPFGYAFNPKARAVLVFSGGPGYMYARATASGASASNDQFTLNAGLAAKIRVGKRFYMRPDVRWHWYEDTHDTDWESTLAFGWTLGK